MKIQSAAKRPQKYQFLESRLMFGADFLTLPVAQSHPNINLSCHVHVDRQRVSGWVYRHSEVGSGSTFKTEATCPQCHSQKVACA